MISRLAAILGIAVTGAAACSPEPQTSSRASGRSRSSAGQAPVASSSAAGQTPVSGAVDLAGPDSLSGTWKLVMGSMTWTVRLAPRPGLPGEYIGLGERETRDEQGKPVTMEVAAVVEKGNLRAWLGLGVIKCTGPIRPTQPTAGKCTEMGGDAAGPFRAERVTTGTP